MQFFILEDDNKTIVYSRPIDTTYVVVVADGSSDDEDDELGVDGFDCLIF